MPPATFQVQYAFFRPQGALQCQGVTKNCAIFMELQKSLLQASQAVWKKSNILTVLVGVCVLLPLPYWCLNMCNFYLKLTGCRRFLFNKKSEVNTFQVCQETRGWTWILDNWLHSSKFKWSRPGTAVFCPAGMLNLCEFFVIFYHTMWKNHGFFFCFPVFPTIFQVATPCLSSCLGF